MARPPVFGRTVFVGGSGDPPLASVLRQSGFTAMVLANNHSYDYGRTGLMETIERLRGAGIDPIGAGPTQGEAMRPRFREAHGIRTALLGFVDLDIEGIMPMPDRPGPAYLDADAFVDSVRAARAQSDLVVVSLHWGKEHEQFPTERQERLATRIIAAGADLIVGHHPHVIQPFERVGSGVVFYSLGNFVFDQNTPETSEGLLVRVRPDVEQDGGPTHPRSWRFDCLPLRIDRCRPRPADTAEARITMTNLGERSGVQFAGPEADGWWEIR